MKRLRSNRLSKRPNKQRSGTRRALLNYLINGKSEPMLSEELKAQVHAMAAKYRERPSNIVWAADRFPDFRCPQSKPRIRVKAIAYHWHLPPLANS